MSKLLISFLLLIGAAFNLAADTPAPDPGNSPIHLKPIDKGGDTSKRPKAPTYSPAYCTVVGGIVTVYCEYDAMGVVTVTDAESGSLIASASEMLGEGIMIMLPADRGAVRIEVEMNGTVYYCVI